MGQTTVVEYMSGEPGSGKSYSRCPRYLIEEFFNPDCPTPKYHWSNFPVRLDPWKDGDGKERPGLIALVCKRYKKVTPEEIRERCRVFPEFALEAWRKGTSGPWEFFADQKISLSSTHIAIDEIHNFCPKSGGSRRSKPWVEWLGEIRHEGATIEFLTQSPRKVSEAIEMHAGLRRKIEKTGLDVDPYFKIPLLDWWNVRTVFGFAFNPSFREGLQREGQKGWVDVGGYPRYHWYKSEYFGAYDSNSASHATGGQGSEAKEVYQVLSRGKLLWWFASRNWFRLLFNYFTSRAAIIAGMLLSVSAPQWLPQMMQPEYKLREARERAKTESVAMPVKTEVLDRPKNEKTVEKAPPAGNVGASEKKEVKTDEKVWKIEAFGAANGSPFVVVDGRAYHVGQKCNGVFIRSIDERAGAVNAGLVDPGLSYGDRVQNEVVAGGQAGRREPIRAGVEGFEPREAKGAASVRKPFDNLFK